MPKAKNSVRRWMSEVEGMEQKEMKDKERSAEEGRYDINTQKVRR